MIEISQAVRDQLDACTPQSIRIAVYGVEGLSAITGADIIKDSFTVDRQGFPEGTAFIGEATAHEVSFSLSNRDGRFDGISLEGALLDVNIGIPTGDGQTFYLPMGIFTVDSALRRGYRIEVTALDNVAKLDILWETALSFPTTHKKIAQEACTLCGLTLATDDFLNANYWVLTKPTAKGLTCRRILQWVAALAGSNVYADHRGQICIGWLHETDIRITPANRYDSELSDESVTVTGVQFTTTEGTVSFEGSRGYVLNFEDNGLAQFVPLDPAVSVAERVIGFTYRGFSAVCRPMPYLWPMDVITFVDRAGGEHRLVVSTVTYTANGTTLVSCEGAGSYTSGQAYTSSGNGVITSSGIEARVLKLESQMADLLYQPISIDAFTNNLNTVEVGYTLTEITLTWGFNKTPKEVRLNGVERFAGSTGETITDLSVESNKPGKLMEWMLSATDERGAMATKTTAVNAYNGVYYGVAAARDTYDSAFILGLAKKTLRNSKLPSFSVDAGAGQYIYYCIPSRFGTCSFTVGGFDGGFRLEGVIAFENASGYSENYYVYRSTNAGLGATTVGVK